MWIRSQDKKMLVDASYIKVCQGAKLIIFVIIKRLGGLKKTRANRR